MRAMGQGAIIHIASICARHGNLSRLADGAFKGGVITLSRLKYRAPERPRARWPRTGLKRRQLA
jgi:NAD(P)-dependent dehydrogenase (short-subunit alcohol dehydrogenase family)